MKGLPDSLLQAVTIALIEHGDTTRIRDVRRLSGGCINNAMRLETDQDSYLMKWNANPVNGMFTAEARGLELLATTESVRVPAVISVIEQQNIQPAFIILEWLEGSGQRDQVMLAEELAEMHRKGVSPTSPPAYGLDHDNTLGSTPQENTWEGDWPQFFAQHRLCPQMDLAARNGRMTGSRRKLLEKLIERLPELLCGIQRRPALIHGDLWSGNVIPGPDGLALIDPAVSYSDREAEIAYTELFGGFSARFYAAYQQSWPLEPGYSDRRDIYNLYHLLNHLNLFGENYGYQVDTILRRYAG